MGEWSKTGVGCGIAKAFFPGILFLFNSVVFRVVEWVGSDRMYACCCVFYQLILLLEKRKRDMKHDCVQGRYGGGKYLPT